MAITINTKYRKASNDVKTDITVTATLVKFRPQTEDRDSLEEHVYLKLSATGATAWYRQVDGLISDGLRGYQYGIDGGSSFTASYSDGLDDFDTEGILTQLEKPAAPTAVDATNEGSGNVSVLFVPPADEADVIAGYYFWHSTDGETWTRAQSAGSGIAKASLDSYTISNVAKKGYTFNVGAGAKYFGVTSADSVSASTEFGESTRAWETTLTTIAA
jgi:hypothetical protein